MADSRLERRWRRRFLSHQNPPRPSSAPRRSRKSSPPHPIIVIDDLDDDDSVPDSTPSTFDLCETSVPGNVDVEYHLVSDDDDTNDGYIDISSRKLNLDFDGTVDECYRIFLRCLKPDGELVDFLNLKGKMKRFDGNSDEEGKPTNERGINTPFNSFITRNNDGHTRTSMITKSSKVAEKLKFREELMDVLKKPYDQDEYDKLWGEISIRKPIEHHRELRGKTKRYSGGRIGKSYLDHHPDLVLIITSMKNDKPRVLNQMRGFFYWLENLTNQGAFIPWKDVVCLHILPKT